MTGYSAPFLASPDQLFAAHFVSQLEGEFHGRGHL